MAKNEKLVDQIIEAIEEARILECAMEEYSKERMLVTAQRLSGTSMTTEEMRQTPDMAAKVAKINKIRFDNSKALMAKGEEALDAYQFDYLLLCNKICGASHYNMQMKIVVEEEKDFNNWLAAQTTFAQTIQQ